MNLSVLHRHASARLAGAGIAEAELDARLLVEHVTGTTRIDLLRAPGRPIEPEAIAALEAALARRVAGEPVHRILGWREFYGRRFALSPETLEPRPDTETLVDLVLPLLRRLPAPRILDLGTGTGILALTLLAELPGARAVGADIAPGALATASENAEALGLAGRFETRLSDWFEKIDGRYDAILSNPPYIEADIIETLAREVRDFDPRAALDGGADGLDAYRRIAIGAPAFLAPGGIVGVEIGHGQKDAAIALFDAAGLAPRAFGTDLAGHDRALIFALRASESTM